MAIILNQVGISVDSLLADISYDSTASPAKEARLIDFKITIQGSYVHIGIGT